VIRNTIHRSVILTSESILSPLADARTLDLRQRLTFLIALFVIELVGISIWLDTESLTHASGLTGLIGHWGATAVRGAVAFAIAFLAFGYLNSDTKLSRVSRNIRHVPIAWWLLVGHFCALIVFAALSHSLFNGGLAASKADLVAIAWVTIGVVGTCLGGLAFVPLRAEFDLIKSTGNVWVYASFAGILSPVLGSVASRLWEPTTALTFRLVTALLHPFISDLISDPATYTIGSKSFNETISRQCSGLEGAGLMLVFSALWLWFFRREYRFPQALCLIPVGVLVLWLANSVRIAVLILIGNAGAPSRGKGVSLAGRLDRFQRSGAGFRGVSTAIAMVLVVVSKELHRPQLFGEPRPPYLMPFLMILAQA